MENARVDRCCCRNVLFCDLQREAREAGVSVEELAEERGCGSACGLCAPYIRLMIRTGLTELPVIGSEQYRRLNRDTPREARPVRA